MILTRAPALTQPVLRHRTEGGAALSGCSGYLFGNPLPFREKPVLSPEDLEYSVLFLAVRLRRSPSLVVVHSLSLLLTWA